MHLWIIVLIYFLYNDDWECHFAFVLFNNKDFVFTCREQLGEGYDGDIAFASSLETFGGGHNDPISVAFGGQSFL